MSARDKLAEIINEYMEVDIPESVPDKHIPTGAGYGLADEIIEAGWRPPMRMISTVEDLEALPDGTIFKGDAYGGVWEKHDGTYWWGNDGFGAEETLKCADEYEMGTLRVIWEPEEDQ